MEVAKVFGMERVVAGPSTEASIMASVMVVTCSRKYSTRQAELEVALYIAYFYHGRCV